MHCDMNGTKSPHSWRTADHVCYKTSLCDEPEAVHRIDSGQFQELDLDVSSKTQACMQSGMLEE